MQDRELEQRRNELAVRISVAKVKLRDLRRLRVQPDGTDFMIAERMLDEELAVCRLQLEELET
jgi:hypothetical protein